jgi:hypothetical protein
MVYSELVESHNGSVASGQPHQSVGRAEENFVSDRSQGHSSSSQQPLFELNDVYVTPYIASFGDISYQIANIVSVHLDRRKKRNPIAIVVFLLGLGIFVVAISQSRATGLAEEYFSMAATGVSLMVAAFFLQLVWPRRGHVLVLKTTSGDVNALTSGKKQFIFEVKKALERAFVIQARRNERP